MPDSIPSRIGSFHIEWHPEIASTNSHATLLSARRDIELPRLIGATRQTAGRGRGQNAWWSSEGAMTCSLLFNPLDYGVEFLRWPQIALTTGLAVADTLENFLPANSVQLKWPNDVYVDGRKICGILAEVPPGCADRLVVGLGINVSNSLEHAPPDIRTAAVTLRDFLSDNVPDFSAVLQQLIPRWEFWLHELAAHRIDFPHVWSERCYLTGQRVSITIGDQMQTGRCVGLDPDGVLLIENEMGLQRILAGTVRRV